MLSFALFRIPIRYNLTKITVVSFTVTLVSLFQWEYLKMGNSAALVIIITFTLLVSFLFNIQILFSLVICLLGYIAGGVIQTLLVIVLIGTQLISSDLLRESLFYASMMQVITAIVISALVYWMSSRKLGFVFFQKRISFNSKHRIPNIFLLCILLFGMLVMQMTIVSFQENAQLIYLLIILIAASAVGLLLTYKKNKKEIDEKFKRTKMK
jgi:hypothetical protein